MEPKLSNKLQRALEFGEEAYIKFKAERLKLSTEVINETNGKLKLHEPLSKLWLQTLTSQKSLIWHMLAIIVFASIINKSQSFGFIGLISSPMDSSYLKTL